MEKILVSGQSGQLGQELSVIANAYKNYKFTFLSRAELDLSMEENIRSVLEDSDFDYFINAGAYTAVDAAEDDASDAYAINGMALFHIANYLPKKCHLIHISTDYVYNPEEATPITESQDCNPQSIYAKSKKQGEEFVTSMLSSYTIIRTSWVYSSFGKNFLKTMQRLGNDKDQLSIVSDQIGTPTYARNIARTIMAFIIKKERKSDKKSITGIYNYSDDGVSNWADFARMIMDKSGLTCYIQEITTKQYNAKAPRPLYSVLSKEKIKSNLGITIPTWQESLQECLDHMISN